MKKTFITIIFLSITIIILAQDQNVNGTLTVNGNLNTGRVYLKRENSSGWGYTYLDYSGHSLIIGSKPGLYAHNEIDFKPGGATQGYIYSSLNLYQANGVDDQKRKIQIHSTGKSFFNGGNVGIGTENPTCALDVNGTIRSKEVKVEATGWADFVFGEDYRLPSLSEVENHIKEKGTLPDIPSEQDVKESGVNLGEMQVKLLQKIEELTLYAIEQEKRIEALENENKKLKNQ